MNRPKILKHVDSQLVGKYYTPSVKIKSNGYTAVSMDTIPTKWVADPTRENTYINCGYEFKVLGNPNFAEDTNHITAIFDNNSGTYVVCKDEGLTIQLSFPSPIILSRVSYRLGDNTVMSIRDLGTGMEIVSADPPYNEIVIEGAGDCQNFDVTFHKKDMSDARMVACALLQFSEFKIHNYKVSFQLDDIPSPLKEGQRIVIKTPDYNIAGVTESELNGITIDTLLKPNRYYELVYNGTKYVVKEVV